MDNGGESTGHSSALVCDGYHDGEQTARMDRGNIGLNIVSGDFT